MVTMTVDGRRTWTVADFTAGRRTSCCAARSVSIRKTLGVAFMPTIERMTDSLVKVAPRICRVRAANDGETLTAKIATRDPAIRIIAASWIGLSDGDFRLTVVRRTCEPERRGGRFGLIIPNPPLAPIRTNRR